MKSILLTVCELTLHIHVQGTSYILWMEEHLPGLERQVKEKAMAGGGVINLLNCWTVNVREATDPKYERPFPRLSLAVLDA